jgi:uncharacterized protein (TIGR03083 family)
VSGARAAGGEANQDALSGARAAGGEANQDALSGARAASGEANQETLSSVARLRGALEESYAAIEAIMAGLSAAHWQAQSLCPDWTVRGVISHLASVEHMMAGWLPASADEVPPLDRLAAFTEQTAGLDDGSFASRVRQVFSDRRRDLAGLTALDLERPSWTPVGPRSYGRFLAIRVFDFWVHERDISCPLGISTADGDERAALALAEVEGSLGYIVGKKVGMPDGSGIVFRLTGPVERLLAVTVDGRAKLVDHLDRPDVELTTDSVTFIQLASGRVDPQAQIDAGKVSWTGNAELGERAARNLRFTM